MDIKTLCFSLSEKIGTPGDESQAAFFAKELLSEYMQTKIDRLGNVIGSTENDGVHILLDAHIDQVGLVVRGFDEKGFILVDKAGSPDPRVLTGAEVIVCGKENLFGVVCSTPPHLQKNSSGDDTIEITSLAIDVGLSKEKAQQLVEIGDRVVFKPFQGELLNDNIVSCSFDDRAGVAVILRALEIVKGKLNNIKVSVTFSVQEETGGSGAKTASFATAPDYAIAIDVGFGDDPYTDKSETITLGKGPSIGISPTLDKSFTKELISICKEKGIPYQHDVMGGRTGTNADSINISGVGVKTALLSVPLRYMHTGNEIINIHDIENTARLIAEYLIKKDGEYNA